MFPCMTLDFLTEPDTAPETSAVFNPLTLLVARKKFPFNLGAVKASVLARDSFYWRWVLTLLENILQFVVNQVACG
jgi:hypothetical protein